MEPPIYLYYTLSDFNSNHRDYAKSRSYPQLRNKTDSSDYRKCEGAKTVMELFDNQTSLYRTPWNYSLIGDDVANPCGLAAKAYFQGKMK